MRVIELLMLWDVKYLLYRMDIIEILQYTTDQEINDSHED